MNETTSNWQIIVTLAQGLLVSLELAGIVLVIGTIGGCMLGIVATYGSTYLRVLAAVLLYLTRGIPLLLQVFAIFYLLPLIGPTFDPFTTAVVALSLFASVTISEIVRAGLMSVPKGQIEAAYALGLKRLTTIILVVLPQALKLLLAPLIGQFVFLIKATAIISLLGVAELMYSAREIIERDLEGFKVMTLVWIFYTAVCMPVSMIGRRIEQTMRSTA